MSLPSTTIEILREPMLPAAAKFLQATIDQEAGRPAASSSEAMLKSLRRQLVDNPTPLADGALGYALHTTDGDVVGVLLMWPVPFVGQGRDWMGLSSSSFFVDPTARMQGFLLFRKFLAVPGIDFCYSTSSNQNSGSLWRKLNGTSVEGSDRELYMPLRFGRFAEELAYRRKLPAPLPQLMRVAGDAVGFVIKPRFARTSLRASPCRDWQFMADLAARYRDPQRLTCARSAEQLQWKYEISTAETFELTDAHGTRGWFSLNFGSRGGKQQIRIATLFDFVWPADRFDAAGSIRLLADLCSHRADALVFEGTITTPLRAALPQLWVNSHGYHRSYVHAKNGSAAQIVKAIEIMPVDGG